LTSRRFSLTPLGRVFTYNISRKLIAVEVTSMSDLIMIGLALAFFAASLGLVKLLEELMED
jgi:hypothetical protein